MKALSFRQPWANLTILNLKRIDNRPRPISYRGRIYIHAAQGKNYFVRGLFTEDLILANLDQRGRDLYFSEPRPRGAIIGEADIVDCVDHSSDPWFVGPWGIILDNIVRYDRPIPWPGALGLFEIDLSNPKPKGGK